MKRLSILLLFASAALLSCKKDKCDNKTLTGTYKGTFQRIGGPFPGQLSNVTLTFNGNNFTGESDVVNYPAICNGTYALPGEKSNFSNSCVWPANFDWTYILNGEYDINIDGNNIEIIRSYNGIVFYQDIYKLIKE